MKILVVTYSKFPEGDAESVRLHSIGKILRDCGHDVFFVGMGQDEFMKDLKFDGFKYISLRKKTNNRISKVFNYINYSKNIKSYINMYLNKESIDAIIFADISPFSIITLKRICKKNNIKLIADSVEWFSPSQFKFGILSLGNLMKNIENKYIINSDIRVIAISNFLYNHFNNKKLKCSRIPAILDVKKISIKKEIDKSKLKILYAGSPGKKDYIYDVLKGLLMLEDKEINKLEFIIAGIELNNIKDLFNEKEILKLNKVVKFLGRIKREEVFNLLSKVDFTVLLRPENERFAKAGFPTKVVESLATYTPVILNISSDLGQYISDMKEGLIVEECSAKSFSKTIKRALELNEIQKEKMRFNSRLCAEKNFDYRLYYNELEKLLF
ncbi:glycosyltransferase [Clostridium perfringens]|nr:glycosyltransferase [Clostridium perfringens]